MMVTHRHSSTAYAHRQHDCCQTASVTEAGACWAPAPAQLVLAGVVCRSAVRKLCHCRLYQVVDQPFEELMIRAATCQVMRLLGLRASAHLLWPLLGSLQWLCLSSLQPKARNDAFRHERPAATPNHCTSTGHSAVCHTDPRMGRCMHCCTRPNPTGEEFARTKHSPQGSPPPFRPCS
jgi:hypothetical protein